MCSILEMRQICSVCILPVLQFSLVLIRRAICFIFSKPKSVLVVARARIFLCSILPCALSIVVCVLMSSGYF